MADIVLDRYSKRCNGPFVNIEAIIEDCGITPIPRRGIRKLVNGYAPKDPRFIVIDETYAAYPPMYRAILAEEFCHIYLEYDLLNSELPSDAHPHVMTFQQYKIIEGDAQYLSRALLMPKREFAKRWEVHFNSAPEDKRHSADMRLIYCAEVLENEFRLWPLLIAYRARDLKIISEDECSTCFSSRIRM